MTKPAPTCRDWPAGTRVRCVDALPDQFIKVGEDYVVHRVSDCQVHITATTGGYWPERFKPVVRVPMGRGPAILPNYTVGPSC